MGNQNEKEMIMTSLGKLKNAIEKFKRISIIDDYTAEERDAIKNKVTEARNKSEVEGKGIYIWKVRGSPKKRAPLDQVYEEQTSRTTSNPIINNILMKDNTAIESSRPKTANTNVCSKVLSKEGLHVFYTNADQFVNKREDLLMRIASDQPDIMLITEIIPKKQEKPITQALLDIDGYKCLLNFNPNEANLGASGIRGVAIYSKNILQVVEVDISIDGFHDHAWIEIPTARGETVLCGCVYRSPACDVDLNGCRKSTQAIVKLLSEAYQRNPNVLIAGDFNYKEIDWLNENAPPGQQHLQDFINTLQDCFLYQHVTEPTRYRANETPNVLDLILSSEEGMIEDLAYNPPPRGK